VQTSERQKEIIAAAFDLISVQGIQELTIKRIARSVGVSEPALYRHFASKADILSAVIDQMIAHRNATFLQVRKESAAACDMIRSFFSVQASLFETRPSLTIMLYPEDLFRNDEVLLGKASAMMDETLSRFREMLRAGVNEESIKPGIDCDAVALLLVGGFRLLVSSWRMDAMEGGLVDGARRFAEGTLPLITR
jgi:AcrR family transcriptional regulator